MELNEKIKKYRKEAGLSQEDLATKIYVSRTLITKYESGSAFPTQENLEKIAIALNVKVEDLLSDKEKNEIVEKSFKTNQRFWMILSICFTSISVILLLLSVIPFYQYSTFSQKSYLSASINFRLHPLQLCFVRIGGCNKKTQTQLKLL